MITKVEIQKVQSAFNRGTLDYESQLLRQTIELALNAAKLYYLAKNETDLDSSDILEILE